MRPKKIILLIVGYMLAGFFLLLFLEGNSFRFCLGIPDVPCEYGMRSYLVWNLLNPAFWLKICLWPLFLFSKISDTVSPPKGPPIIWVTPVITR